MQPQLILTEHYVSAFTRASLAIRVKIKLSQSAFTTSGDT